MYIGLILGPLLSSCPLLNDDDALSPEDDELVLFLPLELNGPLWPLDDEEAPTLVVAPNKDFNSRELTHCDVPVDSFVMVTDPYFCSPLPEPLVEELEDDLETELALLLLDEEEELSLVLLPELLLLLPLPLPSVNCHFDFNSLSLLLVPAPEGITVTLGGRFSPEGETVEEEELLLLLPPPPPTDDNPVLNDEKLLEEEELVVENLLMEGDAGALVVVPPISALLSFAFFGSWWSNSSDSSSRPPVGDSRLRDSLSGGEALPMSTSLTLQAFTLLFDPDSSLELEDASASFMSVAFISSVTEVFLERLPFRNFS